VVTPAAASDPIVYLKALPSPDVLRLQLTPTVDEVGNDPFDPDKRLASCSNTAASPQ
jgi:hypothetical protein